MQNILLKSSWQPIAATLLFYVTGWLAMVIALPPVYIATIWAPAGIGVAAILMCGYRVIPYIFMANILLYLKFFELATLISSPQKLLVLAGVSLCGVLRAWLGAILIKRFAQTPYVLVDFKQIGLFFILAGPAAAFVPTALMVFALQNSGVIIPSEVYATFLKTLLADFSGVVIFIPLFFIIFDREGSIWEDRIIRLGLPLILCFFVISALSLFFQSNGIQSSYFDSAFLPAFVSVVLLILTGGNESIRMQVEERTKLLTQSNRKLKARDRQFNKLVQTQSVIVWRADPVSFRFLYVNDEAEAILGYPVSQWREERDFWHNRIHDDDKERVQAFCAEEKSPRNSDLEYRMITADGKIVWLRDIFTKVIKNGVVDELYGLMLDITKQKLAEEEFRVAAITFESQQGIMITNNASKIIRVNHAFTQITGFSSREVVGKDPDLFKSGRHDELFYDDFWRQLTLTGTFEGEVWNRRKDGEVYPEWQTVTAVENNGVVTHYVYVFSDITQKKEAEDKIHSLAFYDALTGLPNRRLLLDRFEQEIAIARRHKQFGAVIFLDLDHFKLLNDSQGHLVGDELLIQVANRLSSVLREEDTPARLGGDEFVVLLHANSESLSVVTEHARTVAEKIRRQLNTPFLLNQYQHQISTSIGITLFPEAAESPDMILQQADTAMYRSKAGGRNAISFFQPSMQEAADQRLNLEQDLRASLDKDGFMLFYQPQVDCSGVMFGAEVLIRWEHAEKGLIVSPADFIPVAEESSLILDIGLWVLKRTCRQIKEWLMMGIKVPRLSVNVSSRQFRQQDFIEQIKAAIGESQIPAYLLGIELTESVMIVDMDDTVAKMKALKKLGVSIAVDDFGTGYSSLIYLKRLPLDVLKIDRCFVRDVLIDTNGAVIVETILSMARHLKLRVIAEGVESEGQFEFLKQQGCLMFQGYHFSRPLPSARFAEKYLLKL